MTPEKLSLSRLEELFVDYGDGGEIVMHECNVKPLIAWAKRAKALIPELLCLVKDQNPGWNDPDESGFPYSDNIKEGDKLLEELGE